MSEPTILCTANQYWLGPLSNLPQFTRYEYAKVETPTEAWQQLQSTESRVRFDDYVDGGVGGGVVNNVQLSPELQGMILAHQNPYDVPDMSLALVTHSAGLEIALPIRMLAKHLVYYNNLPNPTPTTPNADYTGSYLWPSTPCWSLTFTREPLPAPGIDPLTQKWQFSWGGGYTLEWSRAASARLLDPLGNVLSRRPREEFRQDVYSMKEQLDFVCYNLLGNLYLLSSAWSGAWIIKRHLDGSRLGLNRDGVLPAAPWRLRGYGGKFGWNAGLLKFDTSGYIETDWVTLPVADASYPDTVYDPVTAPDGCEGTAWPAPPTGCGVSVAVCDSRTTPDVAKRYRVSLTGNGFTTPIVQAFEYKFYPLFSTPTDDWVEVTPWAAKDSGEETLTGAMAANTLKLNLLPLEQVDGQTLWQTIADTLGSLQGEYALKYVIGNRYSDGTTDTLDRGILITHLQDRKAELAELPTLTLTASDFFDRLSGNKGTLLFGPCCAGMAVEEGMRQIALCGGVAPGNIVVSPLGHVLDKPEPDGEFLGGVNWLPANGTKCLEFLQEMAEPYSAYARMFPDGTLHIWPKTLAAPLLTVSAQAGAPDRQAVKSWTLTADTSAIVNTVIREGLGVDGKPVLCARQDLPSIFTPDQYTFTGQIAVDYARRTDLTRKGSVNLAVANAFKWRPGGFPRRAWTSPTADLWKLVPHVNRLTFVDENGSSAVWYLLTVTTKLGVDRNEPTVTGELRA